LRTLARVFLFSWVAVSAPVVAHAQSRGSGQPATAPAGSNGPGRPDDLSRARTLDREGAKAYADGRYNDAIRYFEEAHRLGGPPFELWNVAKCHLRLDQPEQAADVLERYLATPSLPADDREEATAQLDALRKRPSTLTVASSPPGATVSVDGRAEPARTPMSTTVSPGPHTVTLTLESYAAYTREIDARFGRAIILDAGLSKDRRPPPPANPYAATDDRRIALRAMLGIALPRFGSVGGGVQLGFSANGIVRVADVGATSFGVGGMLSVTGDSWKNTINAPGNAQPCGPLTGTTSATALSAFGIGAAGWELVPQLRVHALAGLGMAAYLAGDLGGDVFVPTCDASPGLRPAALVGAQVDYAVTKSFRLTALPIALQLHPAFGAARSAPIDATGVWLKTTIAVGAGVDL